MASGSQFPTFSVVPHYVSNSWDEVRDLCKAYGLILDPWQENVLRGAMGERRDGLWAASRVGLSVPRQNGKTALLEARELAGLLLFGEELLVHSAHLVPTALEGFHRIKGYFENYDDLSKRVRRVREANGEQAIEMMTGQRLMFKSRQRGGGRGFSADVLLLDEAQILPERAFAAMLPTVSARPNPQVWLTGTPPGPDDDGESFGRIRDAAKSGRDARLCWMEWSIEGAIDVDDRLQWGQSNPALGYRLDPNFVLDERHSFDKDTFARERLGHWTADVRSTWSVIDKDLWVARAVTESPSGGRVGYGLDMSPDRAWLSIGVAAQPMSGPVHLEVVEHRPTTEGTAWAVDWLAERWPKAAAVVIDEYSPAMSLKPELEARHVRVTVTRAPDMAKACGMFFDGVRDGTVTHFSQEHLSKALAGASKRPIGSAGGWGWDRRDPSVDLTPLVTVTEALYGVMTSRRRLTNGRTSGRVGVVL